MHPALGDDEAPCVIENIAIVVYLDGQRDHMDRLNAWNRRPPTPADELVRSALSHYHSHLNQRLDHEKDGNQILNRAIIAVLREQIAAVEAALSAKETKP